MVRFYYISHSQWQPYPLPPPHLKEAIHCEKMSPKDLWEGVGYWAYEISKQHVSQDSGALKPKNSS